MNQFSLTHSARNPVERFDDPDIRGLAEPDQAGAFRRCDTNRPGDPVAEDLALRLQGLDLAMESIPARSSQNGQETAEEVRHCPIVNRGRIPRPTEAMSNLSRDALGLVRSICITLVGLEERCTPPQLAGHGTINCRPTGVCRLSTGHFDADFQIVRRETV